MTEDFIDHHRAEVEALITAAAEEKVELIVTLVDGENVRTKAHASTVGRLVAALQNLSIGRQLAAEAGFPEILEVSRAIELLESVVSLGTEVPSNAE